MSEVPPLDYPRDSSSKRGAKEKPLDPNDPNDNAFVLVTKYNVPPEQALQITQATCDRSGFYARIRRWRENESSMQLMLLLSSDTSGTPLSSLSSASASGATIKLPISGVHDVHDGDTVSTSGSLVTNSDIDKAKFEDRDIDFCDWDEEDDESWVTRGKNGKMLRG